MGSIKHLRRRGALAAAALLGTLALLAVPAAAVENIDPAGDGSQFAYGENIGWLNAEPLGDGGPGIEVGDLGLTGYMWGENIGWVSLSCVNTASCGSVAYGVTHDGAGVLSGFAWAENAGWISFSCGNTASCGSAAYGVTIDPLTGEFGGHAWGENIGFISFASDGAHPFRLRTGWSTCSAPAESPHLGVSKAGADTTLVWSSVPLATAYDVIRGDLLQLRVAGDFAGSTQACIADDQPGTSTLDGANPASGAGYWFLVRAEGCSSGSYDSGEPSQAAPRDAGVLASGNSCN